MPPAARPAQEAVAAFESACALEGATKETTRALEEARRKRAEWEKAQGDLDFARKRTTIRQASDQYEEERFAAKLAAKRDGRIAEIGQWDETMRSISRRSTLTTSSRRRASSSR